MILKDIERYLNKIIKTLDCGPEEKKDIRLEFLDHLNLLKKEYIEKGYSEEEATKKAMKDFGEEHTVSSEMNKSVSKYRRIIKKSLKILWWLYILIIFYLLLSPFRRFHISSSPVNLIPFKQISEYIIRYNYYNFDIWFNNLFGNMLLFMPFGFMLPLCFRKGTDIKNSLFYVIMFSFFIEFFQNIFHVGIFDIDDIILNVMGGVIGFGVYKLLLKLLKHKKLEYLL